MSSSTVRVVDPQASCRDLAAKGQLCQSCTAFTVLIACEQFRRQPEVDYFKSIKESFPNIPKCLPLGVPVRQRYCYKNEALEFTRRQIVEEDTAAFINSLTMFLRQFPYARDLIDDDLREKYFAQSWCDWVFLPSPRPKFDDVTDLQLTHLYERMRELEASTRQWRNAISPGIAHSHPDMRTIRFLLEFWKVWMKQYNWRFDLIYVMALLDKVESSVQEMSKSSSIPDKT